MSELEPYYTIIIPFVPREFATEWHPTEPDGAFGKLTRGNFKTEAEAITWGKEKLDGTPYEVKLIDPNVITITIERDHDRGFQWKVSDDGTAFETMFHPTRERADVDANKRHDSYVDAEPKVTIKIRNVERDS